MRLLRIFPILLPVCCSLTVLGQNVGIGTAMPNAPFHVWSSGQVMVPGGLVLLGNRAEGHLEMDFNVIDSRFGASDVLPLGINPSGGDVGINTTNPQSPFHVWSPGQVTTPGGMVIFGNTSEGHLEIDFDRIQHNVGVASGVLSLQPDGGEVNILNGLIFADGLASQVGINTINPMADFAVSGTTHISGATTVGDLISNDDIFVADDLFLGHVLEHDGDANTEIVFTTDRIRLTAGGEVMLDLDEGASDIVLIGGTNIDVNMSNSHLFVNGSDEQVGIGTTTPDGGLHIMMTNSLNSGLKLENSSNLQDWRFLVNGNGNLDLFWQDNLRGRFDSSDGSYNPLSDARYKTEIRQLDIGLEHLMRLRPVSYSIINDETQSRHIGFLAQEVERILPSAVMHDAESGVHTLSYDELSVLTVRALQQLAVEVQTLKAENANLRQANQSLTIRLKKLEDEMQNSTDSSDRK